jgi:hypothetical protein
LALYLDEKAMNDGFIALFNAGKVPCLYACNEDDSKGIEDIFYFAFAGATIKIMRDNILVPILQRGHVGFG